MRILEESISKIAKKSDKQMPPLDLVKNKCDQVQGRVRWRYIVHGTGFDLGSNCQAAFGFIANLSATFIILQPSGNQDRHD